MTTLLERRYRSVLRLLPSYYRGAREEEMVETYLYGIPEADREWMRPALGEVASVAALAVRSRFGVAGAPRGYALLGRTARLFAVLGVLLQATTAVTERALTLAWADGSPEHRAMLFGTFSDGGAAAGAREAALWVLPLLWGAGLAALLTDRRRTASVLVTLAALPATEAVAEVLLRGEGFSAATFGTPAAAVLAWLTALAVWCGYHADAEPARLPLAPPGLAFLAACVLMGGAVALWPEGADSQTGAGVLFVVAGVAYLVVRARRRAGASDTPPDPAAALAPAALGLLLLALRVGTVTILAEAGAPAGVLAGAAAETAAVALTAAALAATGARALTARPRSAPAGP